jgi:hypothetical protein
MKRSRKFRSTRASRIRYDLPSVMHARAAAKAKERDRSQGNYVLGNLCAVGGRVVLQAIRQVPTWEESEELTDRARLMRLWRTKQAANQWAARRPHLQLRCLQVNHMNVRQGSDAGSTLTDGQPAGGAETAA